MVQSESGLVICDVELGEIAKVLVRWQWHINNCCPFIWSSIWSNSFRTNDLNQASPSGAEKVHETNHGWYSLNVERMDSISVMFDFHPVSTGFCPA